MVFFRDVIPPEGTGKIISLKPKDQRKSLARADVQRENRRVTARRDPQGAKSILIPAETNLEKTKRIREIGVVLVLGCAVLFIITAISLVESGLKLKHNIVEAASSGFQKIMSGAQAIQGSKFDEAAALFQDAGATFKNIENHTWFTESRLPTMTLKDPVFEAGHSLIAAGQYLAQAGGIFTRVSRNLKFLPTYFFEGNRDASQIPRSSLTKKLKDELPDILESSKLLAQTNDEIQKIPASFVPASLRERFRFAQDSLATLVDFLKNLQSDIPAILALLGDKEPHTYLVLLQNNAELRPSGGFIGSYMIIETHDGYLTKNQVFDIYASDHELNEVLAPPAEILPVNKRWFMRDSNYSIHFPLSATKAAWFLEKEGGPGVDSVIAIDTTDIEELLRLAGPVAIPELSQPLSSENFATVLSYMIEAKLSGRQDPKAILKSFIPAFQKALFHNTDPVALLPFMNAAIEGKHILAYSKIPEVQSFFERHGVAELMQKSDPKQDFLAIAHTSISGNKSDTYMTEDIHHDTFIKSDGSLIDELTLVRTHHWDDKMENKVQNILAAFGFHDIPRPVFAILGGSPNIHNLRIYVPSGTTLEESSDPTVAAHVDDETGKPYFSATMKTAINQSSTLSLKYRLPFRLQLDPVDKYSLFVQKQPGQNNITIEKRLFPESRVLNYQYFPQNGSFESDGTWHYTSELTGDISFSSIWGK